MNKLNFKQFVKHSIPFQIYKYKLRKENKNIKYIFYNGSKLKQIKKLTQCIKITLKSGRFISWIDETITIANINILVGNMPPKYDLILKNSINELIEKNKNGNDINKQNYELLLIIKDYINRIVEEIDKSDIEDKPRHIKEFLDMLEKPASSLEDALQRILLWSTLFWQTNHKLVGLGRLDLILNDYIDGLEYESDILPLVNDFIDELHKHYGFKSNTIKGDIGQIIIVGGKNEDKSYFYNKLTYAFLETTMNLKLPDPKVLLRVSNKTPKSLLELASKSIATGIGSPILSNDEKVIPALIDFGYEIADAYNYVTAACWEPLSYGNSFEQNNLIDIRYGEVIVQSLKDPDVMHCDDFDSYMKLFYKHLDDEINRVIDVLNWFTWENDPLYTLFTDGCIENNKDISEGGSKYKNYGVLTTGMGNTINSLFNLKNLVFEEKNYSIKQIHEMWIKDDESLCEKLDDEPKYFGKTDRDIVAITNEISEYTSNALNKYRNRFGGKVKFGLSSPNYVNTADGVGATFDGRKSNEPFSVHISCDEPLPYTELVNFASRLNNDGISANGNVVDFFVSPTLIKNSIDKFALFIKNSIKQGFFEMQMNVVDSTTLIDAKLHPDKHTDLIVRVWGFSAYFNDLPDEYKNVLIARAQESERAS